MAIIPVSFKTTYSGSQTTDWVEVAPSGEAFEKTRTWHRIKDLQPPADVDPASPSHMALLHRWNIVSPAYDAWKKGMDIPEGGTPLAAWSGVTPDQADVFRRMGIKTVEGVADMGEGAVNRLPFSNKARYPQLARDFIDGHTKADAAREMEVMREKMAAMEEMLAERMTEKRGPGRPKKEEAA